MIQISRPVAPPAPVIASLPRQSSSDSPVASYLLFLVGVFGALCREALRWKRLIEQRKTARYLRLPYLIVSGLLVAAAGGVALLFSRTVPSAYSLVVAFVAGAGFEKIVQMAAKLKFWTPSVPMGTDSDSYGKPESPTSYIRRPHFGAEPESDLLNYLRHGE